MIGRQDAEEGIEVANKKEAEMLTQFHWDWEENKIEITMPWIFFFQVGKILNVLVTSREPVRKLCLLLLPEVAVTFRRLIWQYQTWNVFFLW